MENTPKKILITGFEPFDNDSVNPSGEWINWMKSRLRISERIVQGVILPVAFKEGFEKFKEIYDDFCPTVVILTGLAKNRTNLTVERIGINWVDARIPDNSGVILKAQKILPEGPDGLFTTVSIESLTHLCAAVGITLRTSTSAGEYVCNDLLYKVLVYAQSQKKNTLVTFIHLPGVDNYDGIYLALETIVNGL